MEDGPDIVVDVVDAANLERNLYLAVQIMELDVPVVVESILAWLPSNWLFRLLQTVFYQSFSWGELLPGLAIVLGTTMILFGLVVWRLRQRDK